jgi:translation initiation factor IF-2
MSNRIPKKLPENLIEFAQLANISDKSLDQIIEKLKRAGVEIKDPHETLSHETKAQLLSFFRGKTDITSDIKQTRVSKLRSKVGSSQNVTITTVSRKPIQAIEKETDESINIDTRESNVTKKPSTPPYTPIIESTESLSLSDSLGKKQKAALPKKKIKLETPLKLAKRNKHKSDSGLEEEELVEDIKPIASTPRSPEKSNYQSTGPLKQTFKKPVQLIARDIWIPNHITVIDLARQMSVKDIEIMSRLEKMGVSLEHYNASIDQDIATLLVEEMGHHPKLLLHNAEEITLRESIDKQMGEVKKRPPIITIMGHVDHGKTSLLDWLRKTTKAAEEAGGITQYINAYRVTIPKGVITFLDTPGHATFTAMRARGAHLTDIVVLVVAADDGVKPQTIEAIEHAKAANVPIVVAINKMDKPGTTVDLVQQGLSKYNLIAEDWGGETLFVPISAKTGEGINDLLEALLLQAEIGELKAPFKGPAQGIIIESRLNKGQGPVATMIVQKGTLRKGDILLAGTSFGRIRVLNDENGKSIPLATPSTPVEILGLSSPPAAGEEAIVVPNERTARELAQVRATKARESQLKAQAHRSLETFIDPFKIQLHKSIQIVLKADVQGSAEALKEALLKLSTEEVTIKLLMTGVGTITESDVNLAIASKAIIFGFNVQADNIAKRLIQREKVIVHYYSIIYELLDEAKKIVNGLLEPTIKETILGKATVREIFRVAKTAAVAGCIVTEGTIHSNHSIRIVRNQAIIHQGKLHSLRRFKDDVKEVNRGTECGISIKNYIDLKIGDIIESYESVAIIRNI